VNISSIFSCSQPDIGIVNFILQIDFSLNVISAERVSLNDPVTTAQQIHIVLGFFFKIIVIGILIDKKDIIEVIHFSEFKFDRLKQGIIQGHNFHGKFHLSEGMGFQFLLHLQTDLPVIRIPGAAEQFIPLSQIRLCREPCQSEEKYAIE